MFIRWFHPKTHDFLHVLGLIILAVGLPFNKILMSIGAIWGVSNLLLVGKFSTYWQNIKSQPLFWLLFSFFGLEIIGLIWTTNLDYGLDDIRKKLPLFAIPITLFAKPLPSLLKRNLIYGFFVASVLFCSLYNVFHFYTREVSAEFIDSRNLSVFISHIRFSMMVFIAIVLCVHFVFQKIFYRTLLLLLIVWFLYYTYLSQVLTGVLCFIAIFYGLLHYHFFKNPWIKWSLFILPFIAFMVLPYFVLQHEFKRHPNPKLEDLDTHTANGNLYYHDLSSNQTENGEYTWAHICESELKEEWKLHSKIPYDSLDAKGQNLKFTIFRYLTFKHLKKDQEGLRKLTDRDFKAIESGFASPAYLQTGFTARFTDLKYQLINNADPNGHSLLQRIEYWKTGLQIVLENWVLGVGTGDVNDAFQKQFEKEDSKLLPENRLRSHNTYLTQFSTYGIAAFVLMLLYFSRSFQFLHESKSRWSFVIFWIFMLTFFIEETLETQAGVSLFALFSSLILSKIIDTPSATSLEGTNLEKGSN